MPQEGGRSKLAIAARRARKTAALADIARMHVEGKSLQEIADALGFCRATIRKWTAEIRAAQLAEAKTNVKHWVRKLLARYEHVWQEAMKAWHRSEEDRVKRKTESTLPAKTPGSDLDAVNSLLASMTRKRTKTTERQSGDAALLAKAMAALQAIRELEGLDPPKQTEVTGPQRGPIQLTVREMTEEQLLALIAQEQAKQQALAVESAPIPEALPPHSSPETASQS